MMEVLSVGGEDGSGSPMIVSGVVVEVVVVVAAAVPSFCGGLSVIF